MKKATPRKTITDKEFQHQQKPCLTKAILRLFFTKKQIQNGSLEC